jgi:hypothetical protein
VYADLVAMQTFIFLLVINQYAKLARCLSNNMKTSLTPEDLQPKANYMIDKLNSNDIRGHCAVCRYFWRGNKVKATAKLICIDKSSKQFGKPLFLCDKDFRQLANAGEVLGA